MYEADYSNQALSFLKKAEKIVAKRIIEKIELLQENPYPREARKVEGYKEKLYRIRAGDYCILYEVEQNAMKIGIIKIDKREKVYD